MVFQNYFRKQISIRPKFPRKKGRRKNKGNWKWTGLAHSTDSVTVSVSVTVRCNVVSTVGIPQNLRSHGRYSPTSTSTVNSQRWLEDPCGPHTVVKSDGASCMAARRSVLSLLSLVILSSPLLTCESSLSLPLSFFPENSLSRIHVGMFFLFLQP